MRVDFREYGLVPMKKYILANKQTGMIYGTYKCGPLGGLNSDPPGYNQYIEEIKYSLADVIYMEEEGGTEWTDLISIKSKSSTKEGI